MNVSSKFPKIVITHAFLYPFQISKMKQAIDEQLISDSRGSFSIFYVFFHFKNQISDVVFGLWQERQRKITKTENN